MFVISFILLIAMSFVIAIPEPELISANVGVDLCNYVFNSISIETGTAVPSAIPYKEERFNIYTLTNSPVGNLILTDGVVESYSCDTIENPTFNVYIEGKDTIDEILGAESMVDELVSKLNSKEIKVEGQTTGKKIKGFFTKIGLNIASWFA